MMDLDALKAIPIANVAESLEIRLPPNGRGRCPLPGHEDRNPSFALRFSTNSFRCFSCGRRGSVIDLVMEMEGRDFAGACRWLRERFGRSETDSSRHKNRFFSSRASNWTIRAARNVAPASDLNPDPEVFGWLLYNAPLQESGREYLRSRGFRDATISSFRIGQLGNRTSTLREACRVFGDTRLRRCGLAVDGRFGPRLIFPSGYLLFPFLDQERVLYLQGRRADNGIEFRWACPKDLPPPAYNLDILAGSSASILICEGVTDVLSAAELGKDALGLLGADSRLDPAIIPKLRQRNVIVIGDADKAGERFSRALVNLLGAYGVTAISRPPPLGASDLNAYLQIRRSQTT